MNNWIYGLPTEEQLIANESRRWLQKTDHGINNICKLLPKEERRMHGGTRYYVYGEKLCEIDEIDYFFCINEFWEFTIDTMDTTAEISGYIQWDGNNAHLILKNFSCKEREELSNETQKILLEHLTKNIFIESQQGKFKITQEEARALDFHLQYYPIDEDGNKIELGKNYFTPFSYVLPPNYQWFPKGVFHFKHDQLLATFNTDTGEFGVCYVVNGVEPEFVWKYNKPTSKPTYFAEIENKIIL